MIVLDTHAWLWWLHDPSRLSARARHAIQEAERRGGIRVSVISVWEIAVKVNLGKLFLPLDVRSWFEQAAEYPGCVIEPLTTSDAIESSQLPGEFHRDPADRIIVAFARRLGAVLVTGDQKIIEYPHVKTVW